MNDALAKMREQLKDLIYKIKVQFAKLFKRPLPKDPKAASTESGETYEISLVPAVKLQLIKAQKIRNRVFFGCIVVSCAALGVVLILFSIKSGQDIAMSNQDKRLESLSEKINSYSELDGLITIQNQLDRHSAIIDNRQMISRAFGALGVMLPQGGDLVKLSELRVNLDTDLITMEGQTDAKVDPLIDYRVLEAFKKSVGLTKYDYGRYVDAEGKEIPTQCIKESDAEGNAFRDGDSYYAWWDLTTPGCEGARVGEFTDDSGDEILYHFSEDAEVETATVQVEVEQENPAATTGGTETNEAETSKTETGTEQNNVEGIVGFEESVTEGLQPNTEVATTKVMVDKEIPVRVKIWRTPRFNKWYEEEKMSLDGTISDVEHFQSVCFAYSGTETTVDNKSSVRWSSSNECYLAKDSLTITGSANGRDESDNLVLRFTATTTYDENFFIYANKHMMAIGPMGQNVTDSFVQISNMFAKEAQACAEDDLECLGDTENSGGDNQGDADESADTNNEEGE